MALPSAPGYRPITFVVLAANSGMVLMQIGRMRCCSMPSMRSTRDTALSDTASAVAYVHRPSWIEPWERVIRVVLRFSRAAHRVHSWPACPFAAGSEVWPCGGQETACAKLAPCSLSAPGVRRWCGCAARPPSSTHLDSLDQSRLHSATGAQLSSSTKWPPRPRVEPCNHSGF